MVAAITSFLLVMLLQTLCVAAARNLVFHVLVQTIVELAQVDHSSILVPAYPYAHRVRTPMRVHAPRAILPARDAQVPHRPSAPPAHQIYSFPTAVASILVIRHIITATIPLASVSRVIQAVVTASTQLILHAQLVQQGNTCINFHVCPHVQVEHMLHILLASHAARIARRAMHLANVLCARMVHSCIKDNASHNVLLASTDATTPDCRDALVTSVANVH